MKYSYLFILVFGLCVGLLAGCSKSETAMQHNASANATPGDSPVLSLHEAAVDGNIPSMTLLIEQGADPYALDANGITPLEAALQVNNERSVTFLLQNGASGKDLSQDGRPLWVAYAGSMTPDIARFMMPGDAPAEEVYQALSGAIAYSPYESTIEYFLAKAQTFPDFASRCFWPAAYVSQNQTVVDSLLIRNILPINGCPNSDEDAPLLVAVKRGKEKLAASLLLLGANPTKRDKAGYTASYYALKNGQKELADKLVAEEEKIRVEEYAAVLARKKAAARKRAGHGDCFIRKADGSTVPCPKL